MNASPGVAGSVRTYMQIEERVLGASDLPGVALRYGFFYGPGTYHDPIHGSVSDQVREHAYPVIGSGPYSRSCTLRTRRLRPWRHLKAILVFTTLWMTILQR